MIISVTSLKGGTGKSTISQNLSVCLAHMGYDILLIDTDTNASSLKWSGLRPKELPVITTVMINDGKALRNNIKKLEKTADIVIIDGTPAMSELASTVMVLADLILIPIKPSAMDIWATEMFLEKYQNIQSIKEDLSAHLVMNQFDSRNKLGQEVEATLKDHLPLPILNTKLHQRVAFCECIIEGKGAYEYKDMKARNEAVALTKEILQLLS